MPHKSKSRTMTFHLHPARVGLKGNPCAEGHHQYTKWLSSTHCVPRASPALKTKQREKPAAQGRVHSMPPSSFPSSAPWHCPASLHCCPGSWGGFGPCHPRWYVLLSASFSNPAAFFPTSLDCGPNPNLPCIRPCLESRGWRV